MYAQRTHLRMEQDTKIDFEYFSLSENRCNRDTFTLHCPQSLMIMMVMTVIIGRITDGRNGCSAHLSQINAWFCKIT